MNNEDNYLIFLNMLSEKLPFSWYVDEGTTNNIKCQVYSWRYWNRDNNDHYEGDWIMSLEELVNDVVEHLTIKV